MAFRHLSAKEIDVVLEIISSHGDCVSKLCAELDAGDEELSVPVLRGLGNIFSADGVPPHFLDAALSSQTLVPTLMSFLGASLASPSGTTTFATPRCHRSLTKESIWLVGNMLSGTAAQKDMVEARGLVAALCALLPNTPFDLQKGIAIALFNAVADGHPSRSAAVFGSQGAIATFVALMTKPDEECVWYALRCVELACSCGYASAVEAEGGMGVLEAMQYREMSRGDIWQTALKLLNGYFCEDDDEELGDGNMFGQSENGDPADAVQNPFGSGFSMDNGSVGGGRGLERDSLLPGGGAGRGRSMVIPAWMQQQQQQQQPMGAE